MCVISSVHVYVLGGAQDILGLTEGEMQNNKIWLFYTLLSVVSMFGYLYKI